MMHMAMLLSLTAFLNNLLYIKLNAEHFPLHRFRCGHCPSLVRGNSKLYLFAQDAISSGNRDISILVAVNVSLLTSNAIYYRYLQRKDYFSISIIVVLKAQCKVRTEPKSGISEPKPELYIPNLEAPIFSVHRAALVMDGHRYHR